MDPARAAPPRFHGKSTGSRRSPRDSPSDLTTSDLSVLAYLHHLLQVGSLVVEATAEKASTSQPVFDGCPATRPLVLMLGLVCRCGGLYLYRVAICGFAAFGSKACVPSAASEQIRTVRLLIHECRGTKPTRHTHQPRQNTQPQRCFKPTVHNVVRISHYLYHRCFIVTSTIASSAVYDSAVTVLICAVLSFDQSWHDNCTTSMQ